MEALVRRAPAGGGASGGGSAGAGAGPGLMSHAFSERRAAWRERWARLAPRHHVIPERVPVGWCPLGQRLSVERRLRTEEELGLRSLLAVVVVFDAGLVPTPFK